MAKTENPIGKKIPILPALLVFLSILNRYTRYNAPQFRRQRPADFWPVYKCLGISKLKDEGHDEGHNGEAHQEIMKIDRLKRALRVSGLLLTLFTEKNGTSLFLEVPCYKADVLSYLP